MSLASSTQQVLRLGNVFTFTGLSIFGINSLTRVAGPAVGPACSYVQRNSSDCIQSAGEGQELGRNAKPVAMAVLVPTQGAGESRSRDNSLLTS